MVFSYLGLSNPINEINTLITASLSRFRKQNGLVAPSLSPGGVFSNNLSETASFASETNMAIYTSAQDLFRKSDIIFVFVPDSALRTLASSLRGHGIRDKIICHFSHGYDASVLDFDHMNTYVSIMHMSTPDGSENVWAAEGYGEGFGNFLDSLKSVGINVTSISSNAKSLLLAGLNIATKMPEMIAEISENLIKKAFESDPPIGEKLMDNRLNADVSFGHIRNLKLINNQKAVLTSQGLNDAGIIYGAYLSVAASEHIQNQNTKSEVKKLTSQLINESLEEI